MPASVAKPCANSEAISRISSPSEARSSGGSCSSEDSRSWSKVGSRASGTSRGAGGGVADAAGAAGPGPPPGPAVAARAPGGAHRGAPPGGAPPRPGPRPGRRAGALLPPRRAGGGARAPRRRHGDQRAPVSRPSGALAAQPLGVVLAGGTHELQLAPAARARAGAAVRGLARGLPPRGSRPLAALLGAASAALARLPRGSRLAAPLRRDARAVSA